MPSKETKQKVLAGSLAAGAIVVLAAALHKGLKSKDHHSTRTTSDPPSYDSRQYQAHSDGENDLDLSTYVPVQTTPSAAHAQQSPRYENSGASSQSQTGQPSNADEIYWAGDCYRKKTDDCPQIRSDTKQDSFARTADMHDASNEILRRIGKNQWS